MAVQVPTRDELLKLAQAKLSALDPEIVVSRDSDIGTRLQLLIEPIYALFFENSKLYDDIFVSNRTSTEGLDLHADARLVGGRKGSTIAIGTGALKITGAADVAIPVGTQLTSSSGVQYQTTTFGRIPVNPNPLEVTVSIESIDTGTQANRDSGETLTFTAAPAGINSQATLTADVTGGTDQESDSELIVRLIDAFQNPPAGGRFSDYRQQANAVEGVASTYTYGPSSGVPGGRRGAGIVDLVILTSGSGANRILATTSSVITDVEDAIESQRPVTVKSFLVFTPTDDDTDVEVEITPKPGYEFDWQKDLAVAVSSYTPGTGEIVLDDEVADFAPTRALAVGKRCLIGHGGTGATRGTQLVTIKTLVDDTPSGQATITVEETLDGDPASGDLFEPAGPLTASLLTAAKAYFDGLGPAKGVGADPNQDWDDVLRSNKLEAALCITGVKDVEVTGIDGVTPTVPTGENAPGKKPTDPGGETAPEIITYRDLNIHPPLGV